MPFTASSSPLSTARKFSGVTSYERLGVKARRSCYLQAHFTGKVTDRPRAPSLELKSKPKAEATFLGSPEPGNWKSPLVWGGWQLGKPSSFSTTYEMGDPTHTQRFCLHRKRTPPSESKGLGPQFASSLLPQHLSSKDTQSSKAMQKNRKKKKSPILPSRFLTCPHGSVVLNLPNAATV